mmetsp:Transcript_33572/g.73261  ORF Transcript_33572/g.73261 Transcript_33572/m.73261 type:complete len:105 (-) Transcript_33572:179-493(-)
MEVEEEVLFDLAKLCDQYQVERLFTHCMHQLTKGLTHQNAVTRLVQAHACEGGGDMWGKLQCATWRYVARNFKGIWRDAQPTLERLNKEHGELFLQLIDGVLRK